MSSWAIVYDIDIKSMKSHGHTKSGVMEFHDAFCKCLLSNHFKKMNGYQIYVSNQENTLMNVYKICKEIKSIQYAELYLKSFNLFKIDDFTDLRSIFFENESPISKLDAMEAKIENIYSETSH